MFSHQNRQSGITEQDRTLSDLLESYRHLQSDPTIDDDLKQRAAERMKDVWAALAKLTDPNGFINFLSDYIQTEYQRRNHADERSDLTQRRKPLCRCDRSKHLCEAKQGQVPSKIQTQDLTYISKPDSNELARDYVQSHKGDVVVREGMKAYQNLRANIYSELSDILAMMMGSDTPTGEGEGQGGLDTPHSPPRGQSDGFHSDSNEPADAPTASADGGAEMDDELERESDVTVLETDGEPGVKDE